ncbi:MAG: glutaredoxin family protein [Chloroflexi bacterium]|nr:glutaredoxin family protein [Chloroflexota bacterium]MCI0574632.1 glutaredoxin family protein [Chloroflexota bacterium]MCI0645917.1 glutaredoxin family protein [Chloroflexota bacterium]MCI0730541.1 glutaredoxin family protein [Chloroflexota bacterium]
MSEENSEEIILYTSDWCAQATAVERFLEEHQVPVRVINISGNPEAQEELVALNDGHASVPTLLFPDGDKLVEPSFGELREKLALGPLPGFLEQLRSLLGRNDDES